MILSDIYKSLEWFVIKIVLLAFAIVLNIVVRSFILLGRLRLGLRHLSPSAKIDLTYICFITEHYLNCFWVFNFSLTPTKEPHHTSKDVLIATIRGTHMIILCLVESAFPRNWS
ncbi:TPA: hypothetical protein DIU27_01695 [Candidatus Collierbacteria bacterium]|uniref:Uncharacterized protein n=1 Tax=Candidatus Collierbacteria bacterium GW2011_GWB2_44_22 TaxID=1618387 RepID=A0A0G1KTH9_9BACT|nr:MAG: hypothetical protein UW31_C0012G0001 [Candidatus Collierbacteria bacterium GW2011_GWA2_44_13]KKT51184.1 MAG: hypothetical protein UW44_C0015G0055 [Candidatus Collierbacteria bacterium GW2011_GWB2_44_22]KKT61261.1 MAG: hypothetical protein UW56_C0029G0001 [Candidatus Collierbacteria bacterium GW2011_GWD1_44_27]KKT65979.1 MAG: hypothetical protein UW58_C0015G0001 [Candidatus Collierbacteria bacterium GW2011_GWC2_44_30]KKT68250.1 MAG: hypothetical protein UW64_C0025G0001 [Microgenomates gr